MISSFTKCCNKFSLFHLETKTRACITASGIRKHQRPYRRSRAGTRLFHRIHAIASNQPLQSSSKCTEIDQCNLIKVPIVKTIANLSENIMNLNVPYLTADQWSTNQLISKLTLSKTNWIYPAKLRPG